MKALVFNGPRDIRFETYPDPLLKTENSVILNVERCSICGSDLHMYHGDNLGTASYSDGVKPFCVGHEFAGEIVEVGKQVTGSRWVTSTASGAPPVASARTVCQVIRSYAVVDGVWVEHRFERWPGGIRECPHGRSDIAAHSRGY